MKNGHTRLVWGFCVCLFFKPVKMTTLIHSYTQSTLGLDGWRWPEASILTSHGAWLDDEWAQVSQHRAWGATDMGIRTHAPLIFQSSELRQPQKGEISLGSRITQNAGLLAPVQMTSPGACVDPFFKRDNGKGYKNLTVARFTSLLPQVVCSTRVSM